MNVVLYPLAGILLALYLDLNFVELALVLILSTQKQWLTRPWFDRAERNFAAFARRKSLCIALAFALPIALRLALLPWQPAPTPWIPDEFSHLLIADTLAHGHLANSTHPLWQHFEAIHEIFVPSYASIYFPGLGVVMALGTLLGHPWVGVLLASGAMCAALLWMLYGFFPPRWALLGGFIAVTRWGGFSYWVNSYWGGSVAALGGALALGSYARLRKRASIPYALTLGLGLVLMAYTRPLEGFVLAIPIVAATLWPYLRLAKLADFARVAIPASAVGGLGLFALGYYFRAITGHYLEIPYRVNQALYGWPLTLPWDHTVPVTFRHTEMQQYFEWERCAQFAKTFPWQFWKSFTIHLQPMYSFFFGPALTLPFLFGRGWWANRKTWLPLAGASISLGLGLVIAAYPHYIAPATACFLVISVQAIRYLRFSAGRNTEQGLGWSRVVIAVCVLMFPIRALLDLRNLPGTVPGHYMFSAHGSDQGKYRASITREMISLPEQHVVFVQYRHPEYKVTEWVYNAADIDHSKIVWAYDMGPERNEEVLRYYPHRKAWLVKPDIALTKLLPYDPSLSLSDAPVPHVPRVCASAT